MNFYYTKYFYVLLQDKALRGQMVIFIDMVSNSTCKHWPLQSIVSVISIPLSVGRGDQAVVHVHVQLLRLGVKHGHQHALQANKHSLSI